MSFSQHTYIQSDYNKRLQNGNSSNLFDELSSSVKEEMPKLKWPFGYFEIMSEEARKRYAASSQLLDMGCEFTFKSTGQEEVLNCSLYTEIHSFSSELGML